MRRIIVITALTAIFSAALSESLFAIPAFARKYKMSCSVCHSPFPRLKDYGEEFAGDGFVLKDKDAPRYYVDAGDENLDLIREFPFAVRLDGHLMYAEDEEKLDFRTPYKLKMLSGGALSENLAYYFYFFFSERGEVAGIEDAYLMFNDIFNADLDIMVGQFQVSDPLFKRELRLSYEDYHLYKVKPGLSRISLSYDRGLMALYSLPYGTDLTFQVLNGNGIGEAGGNQAFDDDKYKPLSLRVSQSLGEAFRIGAFGLQGKEESGDNLNKVTYWGPDASVTLGPFELNVQYLEREDTNPLFTAAGVKYLTRSALLEFIISPKGDKSKWYASMLYNYIDSDDFLTEYETTSAHFSYMLRTNVRLVWDFIYDNNYKSGLTGVGFAIGM